jgi:hypothetical protein
VTADDILSTKALAESDARRKTWEAAQGDAKCPHCPHRVVEHCSRNLQRTEGACCAGYCFTDDECPCPGYAS